MTPTPLNSLADLMAGLQPAAAQTAPVAVQVPVLGSVYVMPLTTAEWLDPDARGLSPEPDATGAHRRAWSVARWLCNAQGQRLIMPDNTAALDLIAALPWKDSLKILDAAGVMDGGQKNG